MIKYKARKTLIKVLFWGIISIVLFLAGGVAVGYYLGEIDLTGKFNMIFLYPAALPFIITLIECLKLIFIKMDFYDEKVVVRKGILSRTENQQAFVGVSGIKITQSIFGRIFNYGTVCFLLTGHKKFSFVDIRKPKKLKEYLETKWVNTTDAKQVGLI